MDVEAKLDRFGRGKMTKGLFEFFCASGCMPGCHICPECINVGDDFRLKNYAKKNKESLTASVMICAKCDKANTNLPYSEARRLIERAGLRENEIDWKKVHPTDCYRPRNRALPTHVLSRAPVGCFVVNGRVCAK